MTSMFQFAPGATLPDHEHVGIEQTYLLDGHLVDKEGPAAGIEVKKGEFVWREPGSRHSAWSPKGGMTVAIMQVPNKFFDDRRPRRPTRSASRSWDQELRGPAHAISEQATNAAQADAMTPSRQAVRSTSIRIWSSPPRWNGRRRAFPAARSRR